MTFKVYYTERAQPNSSFVKRAWYDADYGTLTLELSGSVYSYQDVRASEYNSLVTADSPGTYYRENLQGRKSGHRLGPVADLQEEVNVRENVADYSAVKVWEKTEPVQIFQDTLKEADGNDLLNTSRVRLNHDLGVLVDSSEEHNHTVYFTVYDIDGDQSAEREHTLKAKSVDNAIEKMFDLAELLDQDIDVKGVLVRFE